MSYYNATNVNRDLDDAAEVDDSNTSRLYKRIDKAMTKAKYKSFGKVSVK